MGSGAFLVETCRQLAEVLIEAWRAHDAAPALLPDEDEVIVARRLVAQKCLYGVDRNPVAVDLAKMSLWLATLARDHPLTFIDHALRHGDSLVGLSRRQIETFHWTGDAPLFQTGFEVMRVREHVERIATLRRRIREADESVSDHDVRDLWRQALDEIEAVRLFGDLVVAAFFEGRKQKDRELRRSAYAALVADGEAEGCRDEIDDRRSAEPPLAPLHWEVEFPEVFDRDSPGFDAMVGNPPFLGGKRISTTLGDGYRDWLALLHAESNSNADLVAHFFRRAFDLVRERGVLGLIATNTIAQGDTRASGLRWICTHGGEIFTGRRRVQWPGPAAVVVSVLHVAKGPVSDRRLIDGRDVERITAFLFHRGGHENPVRLAANAGKSFQGSIVLGMGFTFDDTDAKGVATSLAEMQRLIDEDPRNREVIFPYIGGQEVNTNPTHAHHRYVINFRDYPLRREALAERDGRRRGNTRLAHEGTAPRVLSWAGATGSERRQWLQSGIVPLDYPGPVAADWPDMLAVVQSKVEPERAKLKRDAYRLRWWQYAEKQLALYRAIAGLDRPLVISQVTQHIAFAFLPAGMVYAHRLYVFCDLRVATFAVLQSRAHEVWARFCGSSLEDRFMYAASDCFETFPFPAGWDTDPALEAAGHAYYDFRAALMVRNDEGLTKTYNRFHDPYENDADVVALRNLHAAMDSAVLGAYGWSDIPTDCEFLLDYEIDAEEVRARKKPYRYRWPDEVRDEVLARLLELNARRAAAEARSEKAAATVERRRGAASQGY